MLSALFLLAIVLSLLLRFTDSDYLFGIIKLFLLEYYVYLSDDIACFYEFVFGCWNYSDSVLFFVFHFIPN